MTDVVALKKLVIETSVLLKHEQRILKMLSAHKVGKKKFVQRRCHSLASILENISGRRGIDSSIFLDLGCTLCALELDDGGVWIMHALVKSVNLPGPSVDPAGFREALTQVRGGLTEDQRQTVQRLRDAAQESATEQVRIRLEKKARQEQERLDRAEKAAQAQAQRERERQAQLELDRAEWLAEARIRVSRANFSLPDFNHLGIRYAELFERQLTFPRAVSELGLDKERASKLKEQSEALRLEKAERDRLSREERQARQAWERSLVPSFNLPERLGITKTEYQKWLAAGRLKPALKREFRKWGQDLELPLFDPKDLDVITPEVIAAWRAQDAAVASANRRAGAQKAAAKTATTRRIKQTLRLHAYGDSFVLARQHPRHVTLCLGPTNSGKTHHAMQALAAASSGIYLAPLRLNALEAYERLKAQGIPVNLMTGEERIVDPQARHVCATVEMCDFRTAYDVAVIDEVQYLGDAQRGWAWTAALLGVCAKELYACGALHADAAVRALLADTSDVIADVRFERKNPLSAMSETVQLHDIVPGDAVVAFSRREVLQFAQLLRQRGLKVSVIYGALSPEVRRAQVQALNDGKTQVVVATDAIGMGINLPIRRVLLSETRKFDGKSMRRLSAAELQQIAGRAGRFGLHDVGLVGALAQSDLTTVRHLLDEKVSALKPPMLVMPTWEHVEHAMTEMATESVCDALAFFDRITFGGVFKQADLRPVMEKARLAEEFRISAQAIFKLACAPADPDHEGDRASLYQAARALENMETLSLPRCPVLLEGGKIFSDALQHAEAHSRRLAFFAWLGCAFPGLVDTEGMAEHRQRLTDFINRALEAQTVEMFKKRKRRYGWRENWSDFEGDDDMA